MSRLPLLTIMALIAELLVHHIYESGAFLKVESRKPPGAEGPALRGQTSSYRYAKIIA